MTCAVVLAAGRSLRMGSPKPLLPFGRRPLIAHVAAAIPRPTVAETFVVVRPGDRAIRSALAPHAVTLVANPDPLGDMLSSLRCGLRALPDGCLAALVVLGDQPGISSDLVEALLAAHRKDPRTIVVPHSLGRRGHPLVLPGNLFHETLHHHDGVGLRGLLRAHPDKVTQVPWPHHDDLSDIDTPADYARLHKTLTQYQPTPPNQHPQGEPT